MKDYQVTGEILGLALRADVQKGKIDEAKAVLALLRRLSGEQDALGANPAAVLRTLVTELKVQVRDLKKAGDQAKLDKTVANFSAFLDELAKNPSQKEPDRNEVKLLADCYESL